VAECGGGAGEEAESEQLRAMNFQRALHMDPPFGLLVRFLQIQSDLGFRAQPKKQFDFG
jgi:hypothetical protein